MKVGPRGVLSSVTPAVGLALRFRRGGVCKRRTPNRKVLRRISLVVGVSIVFMHTSLVSKHVVNSTSPRGVSSGDRDSPAWP